MNNLNGIAITILFFIGLFLVTSCDSPGSTFVIGSDSFEIGIDRRGNLISLFDKKSELDYISKDSLSPLLSLRKDSVILMPLKAEFEKESNTISLVYIDDINAEVSIEQKSTHINFELISLTDLSSINMVIWGPFQTTIDEQIGETIGVVRNKEFAIGLQALNPKTLGGYPWTDNDCMPQINIFAQSDLTDMKEVNKDYVLYRVEAAKPTKYGSSLQAYCRNRFEDRIIENLDHEKYLAPAFNNENVIGTKIALFGVSSDRTLDAIGQIEKEEGLPHPLLDGEWAKTSSKAASAYIIMGFGVNDIDRAIEITKQAGLEYLYHQGPFETWGHFELKKHQFPKGEEDLKFCVDRAAEQGIKVGVHTLSNFITTNDAYVTPIPDPRLAKVGSSFITADVDPNQKDIPIENPQFFNQFKNNHLHTVVINEELIRYETVSEDSPWRLLNCERGVFDTKAGTHKANDEISKLADHGYKVFLTDASLSMEVAENIGDLFNKTGLRQISFDGLEGNRSTGMGNYGEILFTNAWYNRINSSIKSHYIADASRTTHYFWHMYTRMNWGEPWYAGFRESQTEYRLKNQAYFKRNMMPGMLGWFRMTESTSIEDIEWMLARSAAFDAGYAFVVDYASLSLNQHSDTILGLVGEWEKARISGSFTEAQKSEMEDVSNEYHLVKKSPEKWQLEHINSIKYKFKDQIRQPGEPTFGLIQFNHTGDKTPLQFNITAKGGNLDNIELEIDNFKRIEIPITITSGQTLKYQGGRKAILYDENWVIIKEVEMNSEDFSLRSGDHAVTIDCDFGESDKGELGVELRLISKVEDVLLKN